MSLKNVDTLFFEIVFFFTYIDSSGHA